MDGQLACWARYCKEPRDGSLLAKTKNALLDEGAQRWPIKSSEWLSGRRKELRYDRVARSSEIFGYELRNSEIIEN